MARIRTLKPELPHDAKLARVSREARYTFVLLFTIADDAGYFRANLKYLVGALYPHDGDVSEETLKGWMEELVGIGVIAWGRLKDGTPVGSMVNWEKHQKIDRPSKSFFRENLARLSRARRETLAHGVSESLSLESLSPESGKALVELRSTQTPDTSGVELRTQERVTREQALQLGAEVVFAYWKARLGKHGRSLFDKKREARITTRLRENGGDVSELLYAIDGALRDDYLMGRDPKAPRAYDGLETILRDRAQVERLVALVPNRNGGHPFLEQQRDSA